MTTFSGDTTHFEGEDVIITFQKEDTSGVWNTEGRITNLNITDGNAELETVRPFGGKSITVTKPAGDYDISFDYVVRDTLFDEMAMSSSTSDVQTTEYRSGNETTRKRWRVILWFLGDGASSKTNTAGTITVPKRVGEIARYIFKDVYKVENSVEFSSEEYTKGSITLRCSPTDEDGYANVFKQFTPQMGTTALATLNTTAHKGVLTWSTTSITWNGGTTSTRYRV